jgi:hypothetical protein
MKTGQPFDEVRWRATHGLAPRGLRAAGDASPYAGE